MADNESKAATGAIAAGPVPAEPVGGAEAAPVPPVPVAPGAAAPVPQVPVAPGAVGPVPEIPVAPDASDPIPEIPVIHGAGDEPDPDLVHVNPVYIPHPRERPASPLLESRPPRAETGKLKTPRPKLPLKSGAKLTPESPASIHLRSMCSEFLDFKRSRLNWQRGMEHEMKAMFPKMDQLLRSLETLSKRISTIPPTVPVDETQLRIENDRLNYLIISSAGVFKHIDEMMGPMKEKAERFTERTTAANLGIDERLKKIIMALCERASPWPTDDSMGPPPPPPAAPSRGPGSGPPSGATGASGSDPSAPAPGSAAVPEQSATVPKDPSEKVPETKVVTQKDLTEAISRITALSSASVVPVSDQSSSDLAERFNFPTIPRTGPATDPSGVGSSKIDPKILTSSAPEVEPGMETSKMIGTSESGMKATGLLPVDCKLHSKFFP